MRTASFAIDAVPSSPHPTNYESFFGLGHAVQADVDKQRICAENAQAFFGI